MSKEKIEKLDNSHTLKSKTYPGRGLIIGMTPSGKKLVQVYWIMGRSDNSRNRVFKREKDAVKNSLYINKDDADTSLIIYYPINVIGNKHIVSNGDQTDTLIDVFKRNCEFEELLDLRTFEPDPPNFTPRISGVIDTDRMNYKISILKTIDNMEDHPSHQSFTYPKFLEGMGHCIHTYYDDSNPLKAYEGEPFLTRIFEDDEDTLKYYWDLLDENNRISILVKSIDSKTNETEITIHNKHL